ncbi:MAG: hypothetical protein AB1797_10290 [bacterium]
MLDPRCWMLDAGCSMLDPRCSILDAGCSMLVKDPVSRIEHRASSLCLSG